MPLTLGLNLSSLRAQTQLSKTSSELSTVFERLSSGQRINRASDDAAGLAIADSLNADARVYTQGVRNLNDGISVLNIADGALQELTNITFRLTELAEQAANGTLGASQRASLDEEAQALKAEYFRIAKSTEFNGRNLFEGDYGVLSLQAGYGSDATISNELGGKIGSGEFAEQTTFTAGNFTSGVVTGDFNNDGHTDFISSSTLDNYLSVYLGTGNGGFAPEAQETFAYATNSIYTADFNNDGILDLITNKISNDLVSVYIGNGDGTFGRYATYSMGDAPYATAIADFNGDGFLDIATNDANDGTTSVRLNNGDGTFQERATFAMGTAVLGISSGDFNNDGIVDLVGVNNSAPFYISVLLGNGDGTFGSNTTFTAGGTSAGTVLVSDVNGDGLDDVLTADRGSNTLSVLIGDGDGTFQTGVTYSLGNLNGWPHAIDVGDFNGDGIVDVVSAESNDNTVSVLLGRGDGTFQGRVSYSAGGAPRWVATDDLNGDGVLDILTANETGDTVSLLFGETTSGVAPILDFSLATQAEAKQALSRFQQKLDHLSTQRGQLGAFQSRIEVAENVLSISAENFKAAESRIRDADIAQESANLVRLQILQQASAAVLGQANQQPELVLQLLRGGA